MSVVALTHLCEGEGRACVSASTTWSFCVDFVFLSRRIRVLFSSSRRCDSDALSPSSFSLRSSSTLVVSVLLCTRRSVSSDFIRRFSISAASVSCKREGMDSDSEEEGPS